MMTPPLLRPSRRFQTLTDQQCYALLATQQVGRVAWNSDELPQIVPVSYALQDGAIYLRTSSISVLAELARPIEVALEADELDPDTRTGWSVVLRGRSQLPDEQAGLRQRWELDSLAPWAPGLRTLVVQIVPYQISGRVIRRLADL